MKRLLSTGIKNTYLINVAYITILLGQFSVKGGLENVSKLLTEY
jgi:hypothetical protein